MGTVESMCYRKEVCFEKRDEFLPEIPDRAEKVGIKGNNVKGESI